MKKFKIVTIVGARPQFIKAIAITKTLQSNKQIKEIIVHTGQHFDQNMSEVFFTELGLPEANYNLELGSLSHAQMTGRMMMGVEEILIKEKPDGMLLYGDTNSTLAAAITAAKMHIPVFHVEAGIRSMKKNRPEEMNRIMTDHLSSVLFPPTEEGELNLKREGIISDPEKPHSPNNPIICNYGDVMFDNFLMFAPVLEKNKEVLNRYELEPGKYLLLTVHRALNTDNSDKLREILDAINELSLSKKIKVLFPVHPRTNAKMNDPEFRPLRKRIEGNPLFILGEPTSFFEMMVLEKFSKLVITDSGGVQKEACFFEKPCIVLLDSTPWRELVKAGVLVEAGSNREKILAAYEYFSRNKKLKYPTIFGDGHAAGKMVDVLTTFLVKFSDYRHEFIYE